MECIPLADHDGDVRTLLCLFGLGCVLPVYYHWHLKTLFAGWLVGLSRCQVPCGQKRRKMHIVLWFLLIHELKLAVSVFSPCAMMGF